jgi:hypothetical protein
VEQPQEFLFDKIDGALEHGRRPRCFVARRCGHSEASVWRSNLETRLPPMLQIRSSAQDAGEEAWG